MQRPFLYLSSAEAQLSLGFGAEAPTERLFFAVMPDPATAQRIAAFAASLVADGVVKGKPLLAE
ncbi:MAG TPA: RNA 2',3'-cyclic phosphodiesterase, partial [Xanthomonadaceae bacterium]|nr:RNA 2',3'-cyclic phosphodiesterase [Xanthomonadaceae bacterium]